MSTPMQSNTIKNGIDALYFKDKEVTRMIRVNTESSIWIYGGDGNRYKEKREKETMLQNKKFLRSIYISDKLTIEEYTI